ncbi:MAG: 1-(5-phosphoribosyl)-5-[(5-phosphoribosylamino)methylideneamino]imidazole-4-carboxamide isomerase [Thermoguttaceae bacterium]
MEIWPAIDIRGGKCVRLRQGDYAQETVYGESPVEMADHWVMQGARRFHLVDLDGAKNGKPTNIDVVEEIINTVEVPCEIGGGIRDEDTICRYLEIGIERIVIGTFALKQSVWFMEMCERYPNKLALGIDARNGMVATDGWLTTSETSAIELARQYAELPLASIIFTDIATDGMLSGPNIPATLQMKESVPIPVICSGGVTTIDDVKKLQHAGIHGCIIGRALYEATIKLPEAVNVAFDF